MRRFHFLAATVTVAIMLAGCSTNRAQFYADKGYYQEDASRSLALNVAVSTGLTKCRDGKCSPLHDVPRSELPASLQTQSNSQIADALSDAWDIGYGVGQVSGVAAAFTGLSGAASGLLNIASVFLGPVTMKDPALVSTVIAWMPTSIAASPERAQKNFASMLSSALPTGPVQGYTSTLIMMHGRNIDYPRISLSNERTERESVEILLSIAPNRPEPVTKGPSWLEQGEAYSWQNWGRGQKSDAEFHDARISIVSKKADHYDRVPWPADLNIRAYFVQVSANLPKWVYIYLPPTDADPYPVILNQGKQLLFVEPL